MALIKQVGNISIFYLPEVLLVFTLLRQTIHALEAIFEDDIFMIELGWSV